MRSARIWAPRNLKTEEANDWIAVIKVPCFVKVQAHTETYNGNLQLVFDTVELAKDEDVDKSVFIKTSKRAEFDIMALDAALDSVIDPHVKELLRITISSVGSYRDVFLTAPAAEVGRYGCRGGALSQAIDVMHAVFSISKNNEDDQMTKDILLCAALLANIGKCVNYEQDDTVIRQTTRGKLFGDSLVGYEVVNAFITSSFSEETDSSLFKRLLHAVAAAHWAGAQPQSYEAVLVRQAYDMTEAAAHVNNVVASARGDDDFTHFDVLTKRSYLKVI
jgi:23S rRNA maturation-related 3'-5' exoribonuclease YhaM